MEPQAVSFYSVGPHPQRRDYLICNQQVVGSSPTAGSLSQRDLQHNVTLGQHRQCHFGVTFESSPPQTHATVSPPKSWRLPRKTAQAPQPPQAHPLPPNRANRARASTHSTAAVHSGSDGLRLLLVPRLRLLPSGLRSLSASGPRSARLTAYGRPRAKRKPPLMLAAVGVSLLRFALRALFAP